MTSTTAANYLYDLGPLLPGEARAAKAEADRTRDVYSLGQAMGLYRAVSLMVQQAKAFGLDLGDLRLAGVDPERELL